MAIERGLVQPKTPGTLKLDAPAGVVTATYEMSGPYVTSVRITNVASYLHARGLQADIPGLGAVTLDVAYGGNFYAIIDPQASFPGLEHIQPSQILAWSPLIRRIFGDKYSFQHPEKPDIRGLSHVMFTGKPTRPDSTGRNAVFYGDKAIDRSPCGTGTSARMAQWAALGRLQPGDTFVHESIIGSQFIGRVEAFKKVGTHTGIIPSIEGWARQTGYNTIFVDDRDPYWRGFQVADSA
jgi:4-hydroxyproline epimerase